VELLATYSSFIIGGAADYSVFNFGGATEYSVLITG
jgi:hypothetical protein